MIEALTYTEEHLDRARHYPLLVLWSPEDDEYVARAEAFRYTVGAGDSPEEAAAAAVRNIATSIAAMEEAGQSVPAPPGSVGGQFQVRLPRSLHAALVQLAESEGVSLNALVAYLLTQATGLERVVALPTPRRRQR